MTNNPTNRMTSPPTVALSMFRTPHYAAVQVQQPVKSRLLMGLFAWMLCGCHPRPDLSKIKVDSNGYISWADAQQIILGCPVDTVAQNHALVASITLKDGKQFLTVEPKIDDVWLLIKSNGLRKKIHYATE